MQDSLDPLTVSLVEGLSQVVRNALATPTRSEQTPEGVPALVHLALRVVALRQELALTEARLESALRSPMALLGTTASERSGARAASTALAQPGARRNRGASPAKTTKTEGSRGPTTLTERVAAEAARRTTPFRTDAIVAAVGGQSTTVRTMLERLVARGVLRKAERGTYVASAPSARKTRAKASESATKAEPASRSKAKSTARNRKAKATVSRPASGTGMSDRALAFLTARAAPLTTSELASALKVAVPSLAAAMSKLVQAGAVHRVSPGVFAVSSKRTAASVEGASHA